MIAFKEYVHAVFHTFFNFKFAQSAYLIGMGFTFVLRKIKHEYLLRTKCRKCGGAIRVYFMRSAFTVNGFGNPSALYDWIICCEETCALAEPIGG